MRARERERDRQRETESALHSEKNAIDQALSPINPQPAIVGSKSYSYTYILYIHT